MILKTRMRRISLEKVEKGWGVNHYIWVESCNFFEKGNTDFKCERIVCHLVNIFANGLWIKHWRKNLKVIVELHEIKVSSICTSMLSVQHGLTRTLTLMMYLNWRIWIKNLNHVILNQLDLFWWSWLVWISIPFLVILCLRVHNNNGF